MSFYFYHVPDDVMIEVRHGTLYLQQGGRWVAVKLSDIPDMMLWADWWRRYMLPSLASLKQQAKS